MFDRADIVELKRILETHPVCRRIPMENSEEAGEFQATSADQGLSVRFKWLSQPTIYHNCRKASWRSIVAPLLFVFSFVTVVDHANAQSPCAAYPQVLSDNQVYGAGSYTSNLGPYNSQYIPAGQTYSECIGITPSTFPNLQLISWAWPELPPSNGSSVYGYLHVSFGNYMNTKPKIPVTSKKVMNIQTLAVTEALTLFGETQNYTGIIDIFLTATAGNNGSKSNMTHEIEIYLHTPESSQTFVKYLPQIGTFTAGGVTWMASIDKKRTPHDIIIMPSAYTDVTAQIIDIKAILSYLTSTGWVAGGSEWFNGFAIGVEPKQGNGALAINTLSVSYQ